MRGRTVRTDRARERFLAVLARNANITDACRRAKISRQAAYEWRADDADFAEAWDLAVKVAVERLEAEAWRRGVEGFEGRPVTYRGRVISRMTEYSDRMLEILLKAHSPDRYADRSKHEHTGADGGPILTRVERVIVDPADKK